MDDFEEDIETDPLGAVKLHNVKKNVDIISQCSLPQNNNLSSKFNPRSRRKTVFFHNKKKGSSIKSSDILFTESPTSSSSNSPFSTNSAIPYIHPSTNDESNNLSSSEPFNRSNTPNKDVNHLNREKIVNSNSIDSFFIYSESSKHGKNTENNNSNQNIKLNEDNDSFLSPIKLSASYVIQVPQFDFSSLLDSNVKIKTDQLAGIIKSLKAQITKEKIDLDDFLDEAAMHMDSINSIQDKLYSHKFYDVNFIREEAIRSVIFREYALKRCNMLQSCSKYNIQLIDNFIDFLSNQSKQRFRSLVPSVDLDAFLSNYLMNYDDPKLQLTQLDLKLSCIVSQIEYLKAQSIPPEQSSQMKHSQSYSKRKHPNEINSINSDQVEIGKSVSNSIKSASFSKQTPIQSVSFTQSNSNSNLNNTGSFSVKSSTDSSQEKIPLTSNSSNFDFLEITNKTKMNNEFVIIDDGLGRMRMFKPYGRTDFVSSFLSPEKKSGRIVARFLSRIYEMTFSDLDMIVTAVTPEPSYYIKVRNLLFDLAWQRMDFPFACVSHLQFPDILDFTPRSLSPSYLPDEVLDTPFNMLNFRLTKRPNKLTKLSTQSNRTVASSEVDNRSMDDINNNINKKDFEYSSSSNDVIANNNNNISSSNESILNNGKNSEYLTSGNASSENMNDSSENTKFNNEFLNNTNTTESSNESLNANNNQSSEIIEKNCVENDNSTEKVEIINRNSENLSTNNNDNDKNNQVNNKQLKDNNNNDECEESPWPFAFTSDYYFAMMCYTNPFTIANRFCEMIQIVANVLQSLAVEVGNEKEEDIEIGFDNIFPVLLTSIYAFGCPGILDALEYCGQFVEFANDPQQKFAMTHCNGIVEQIRRTRADEFKRRAMKNKNQPIFAVKK